MYEGLLVGTLGEASRRRRPGILGVPPRLSYTLNLPCRARQRFIV